MSTMHPARVEHHHQRWLRNDARLWMRHDAHRFAPPPPPPPKSSAARRFEQRQADEEQAARDEELKAFYAEHLQLRQQLADLKFDLALRRIFRKYNPNQPRVPAGSREGGQWTSGGGESAGDGSHQPSRDAAGSGQRIRFAQLTSPAGTVTDASGPQFSPDKPGWHDYRLGPNLACGAELRCSREEMADQFARFSLPGRDPSMPIKDEGIYPVHIPDTNVHVGDVRTRITDDGMTIENRTEEGHIFFDGVVVRKLTQTDDGAWYVTTRGFGNNVQPGTNVVNQLVGPEVFNELDRQMRANIERHHAKGILDLAVYRLDGGGRPRVRHAVLGARHEIV
jgi:hypothetical protein